eukprot:310339-Chlamydomonas_euryale.AAC.2
MQTWEWSANMCGCDAPLPQSPDPAAMHPDCAHVPAAHVSCNMKHDIRRWICGDPAAAAAPP